MRLAMVRPKAKVSIPANSCRNILRGIGSPACLGIKIEPAVGKAACFEHFDHAANRIIKIGWELVGVSTQQLVALVRID